MANDIKLKAVEAYLDTKMEAAIFKDFFYKPKNDRGWNVKYDWHMSKYWILWWNRWFYCG